MNWRTTWRHHARTVLELVRLRDIPTTIVLWAGPSQLDGTPIMLVGSRIAEPSQNRKTGDMVQVSIMRQDMPPVDAWRIGADGAVCPDACSHRSRARGGRGTCYVNKARLSSTWQAARREAIAGRIGVPPFFFARARVRLGMEGDPAAIPVEVIAPVLDAAGAWTGYSAAWRILPDAWRRYVMASCDTPADAVEAMARGWRPFASSTSLEMDAEYRAAGLTLCDAERPTAKTCAACLRCNGAGRHPASPTPRTKARPGAYLPIHGAHGSRYRQKAAAPAAAPQPAAP